MSKIWIKVNIRKRLKANIYSVSWGKKFIKRNSESQEPAYAYLKNRFTAIEKAIAFFLGTKELNLITASYEKEMTNRIVQAREHS